MRQILEITAWRHTAMNFNTIFSIGTFFGAFGVHAQVAMIPLGGLAGEYSYSRPFALSGNGQVAVGSSLPDSRVAGSEAFRWTPESGMAGFGRPPRGESLALGVSPSGMYVVGYTRTRTNETRGAVWRADGAVFEIPDIPGGNIVSAAGDVSDTGVVVGSSQYDFGVNGAVSEAFRWTPKDGLQRLGFLNQTDTFSSAYAVSSDGTVIAGGSDSGNWLWTEEQGMVPVAWDGFASYGMTNDGRYLIGTTQELVNDRMAPVPVAWSVDYGRIDLDISDIPKNGAGMIPTDASLDAEIIVGSLIEPGNKLVPYIWTGQGATGMVFQDYLLALGLDISESGYEFQEFAGISDDGTRFLLEAFNPDGDREAVLVTIPSPSTIVVFGAGFVLRRRRR